MRPGTVRRSPCARRWRAVMAVAIAVSIVSGTRASEGETDGASARRAALCLVVMDPLAKELACDCVQGYAQRRYEALAMVLERKIGRACTSICGTRLETYWKDNQPVHLIVGKCSDVSAQAARMGRKIYPLVALTDSKGETTLRGLFVVLAGNSAKSLADLDGYRVVFGPEDNEEKHAAAIAALRKAGVEGSGTDPAETVATCTDAANLLMKSADDEQIAAVISDYARVLLEGCHTVPPGSLRVIGRTDPVEFITVFATGEVTADLRHQLRRALLASNRLTPLLKLLETRDGFKPVAADKESPERRFGWHDFRGPGRKGLVPSLPDSLDGLRTAWTVSLDDNGLGGVAATERWVVVTDREAASNSDFLKVFDAQLGRPALSVRLARPAGPEPDPELDYGESIRSSPVIHGDRIFVVDAFGTFFSCPMPEAGTVASEAIVTGQRCDRLVDGFKLTPWGVASTPLLTGGLVVVNVCGEQTSLLALDGRSLQPIWKGEGNGTGYASCIVGTFGGRQQIVGYQSDCLSGWDVDTGSRLWCVRPDVEGDYNVPTPVAVGPRRLLLATENNGTRLHEFGEHGKLQPEPVAVNDEVAPDTTTPVVVGQFAYITSADTLWRLDLNSGLTSDWSKQDHAFMGHASLIADVKGHRLLVVTYTGELLLFDISGSVPQLTSRKRWIGQALEEEIYSHPAIVGNRLYLRGINSLSCVLMGPSR